MDIMGVAVLGAVLLGIVVFTIRALVSLWSERQNAAPRRRSDDSAFWESAIPDEAPPGFF